MAATGRGCVFLVSLVFLGAVSLSAQSTTINLDVVVSPKGGLPVAGLVESDFTLLDNKTPRPLTSFQAVDGTHEPVHVILVIDAVNVAFRNLAYQRGEIDKFLRADGGHLAQPVALAYFTDTGTQIQEEYSTDGNAIRAAFDQYGIGLRDIRRSSQYEGIDRFRLSIAALGLLAERAGSIPGRKLIFWISPGWPLLSGPGIQLDNKQQSQLFASIVGLSAKLRETRTTLYNVNPIGANEDVGRQFYYQDFVKGVSKPGQVYVGDLSLQVIATQTGGLVLSGSNDLAGMLKQCMADSAAYYALSFTGAKPDRRDEYHHIEVRVNKPGLLARTRDGYYAEP